MCLYTKNKKPSIAEKDIRCYKVLMCRDGKYMSPYRLTDYTNAIENHECMKGEGNGEPEFLCGEYKIDRGYIHCFIPNKKGLMRLCGYIHEVYRNLSTFKEWKYVIFECVIPKDSKYYVNEETGEIASEEIEIRDDVTEKFIKLNNESETMFRLEFKERKDNYGWNIPLHKYTYLQSLNEKLYNEIFNDKDK